MILSLVLYREPILNLINLRAKLHEKLQGNFKMSGGFQMS